MIPRQRVGPTPERRALEALRGGHLVTGPHVAMLEDALKARAGCPHVVLTANGFAALLAALLALDVAGRPVVLPAASSCFALLHAVTAAGARPVFCDLDTHGRVDPQAVARLLATAADRPAAIVAPSLFGIANREEELDALGVPWVDDAAQAAHALLTADPRPFARTEGRIRLLSFYPSKHLNGIDGGAILTDRADVADMARERVAYDHTTTPGTVQRYNLRLPNLHAAVALESLEGVEAAAARLEALRRRYDAIFARHPAVVRLGGAGEALSRYVVRLPAARDVAPFLAAMAARGVQCGREFLWLADKGGAAHAVAAALVDGTVSIPFYPDLSGDEAEHVAAALEDVLTAGVGERS